jgi:hypothetical protein
MSERRCPPPWFIEDIGGYFVVKASNGRPLVFIYYWDGVARRRWRYQRRGEAVGPF